MVVTERYSRY